MEDVERCGNIVPKFPGWPLQSGLANRVILTTNLGPALTAGLRLEPPPEPYRVQGGFAR